MTKVGAHWYYDFTEETRNGFQIENICKDLYKELDYLSDKEFMIVPRGKSRIFHIDEGTFTKVKQDATVYNLNTFLDAYNNGKNPFKTYSYNNNHWTDQFGYSRVTRKLSSEVSITQKDGSVKWYQDYTKEFDILLLESDERFPIQKLFERVEESVGQIGHSERKERNIQELEDRVGKDVFYLNLSLSITSTGFLGMGSSYIKATYLKKVDDYPIKINKESK
jgi:hypothetical protein